MKKNILFIFIIISFVFCSWTEKRKNTLNINSWSIHIGKKEILASRKKKQMGETAIVDLKKIETTDTLFVQRYLCGYTGQNSNSTLTIKNQQNEIIHETVNKNNQLMFTAKMAMSNILSSKKFHPDIILSVFFSIDSKSENLKQTVLIGKLKIK